MLYFGEPLLAAPPTICPGNNADCPVHGFGLARERADFLEEAINQHAASCQNHEALTVDFPRLMAGPSDLDLLSPTEVLFIGYMLGLHNYLLTEWIEQVNPEHSLPDWMQKIARAAREKGGIVSVQSMSLDEAPQHIRDVIQQLMKRDGKEGSDEPQV